MPKNRILYNCQSIYVGPSPSSGYHFIDINGNLNNTIEASNTNFNLIKRITRATNLGYTISLNREEIKQMGQSTIAAHPIIKNPNVQVDFEYYPNGVINELRLGLNANYTQISGINSGQPYYQNNFNNFIFSGMTNYDTNVQPAEEPYWPSNNRSVRNIFATVTKTENDDEIFINDLNTPTQNFRNQNVIAFGDAYMVSYNTNCTIGALPTVRTSFIADNIVFYTGSSGLGIPAISPKSGNQLSDIKFVIPAEPDIQDISVIVPGDISIDIEQTGIDSSVSMNNITGLGVKFSDIKIQNYSIDIKFDREDMESIGYKAPASRRINFPVRVDLDFTSLAGDESAANLKDLIVKDDKYNISLKMKKRGTNEEILRYDFKKAFLEDFAYASSIENNRSINFSFRSYCAPDDLSQGLFISGQIPNQNLRVPY